MVGRWKKETAARGYTAFFVLRPNALFWSVRAPSVRKRRSRWPKTSSTNSPYVAFSFVVPEESLFPLGDDKYVYKVVQGRAQRQKVEIVKLLMARARFLIFDEPTSVLAPHEIDELMHVFRQLRQDGLGVLFITHKLREVIAVADRITILRRGGVAATMPAGGAVC